MECLAFGQVGGADMGGKAVAGRRELFDLAVQLGELGLPLFALPGLAGVGDATLRASDAGAQPADDLLDFAADGVDHRCLGVGRVQDMVRRGIKVELPAHVLEEVLLRPPRERGASGLGLPCSYNFG